MEPRFNSPLYTIRAGYFLFLNKRIYTSQYFVAAQSLTTCKLLRRFASCSHLCVYVSLGDIALSRLSHLLPVSFFAASRLARIYAFTSAWAILRCRGSVMYYSYTPSLRLELLIYALKVNAHIFRINLYNFIKLKNTEE